MARTDGVAALDGLLEAGRPDPKAVANVIAAHPDQRSALISRIQHTLGNSFM